MKILVVSTNAGTRMGGEAMKAVQYFAHLLSEGRDARLVTHARNRDELVAMFDPARLIFVEDGLAQRAAWRSRVGRPLVGMLFHRAVARLARRFDPADTVLHYLCPISPVAPRFAPSGYRVVIGPLSGNIHYPPALGRRAPLKGRAMARLHAPAQRLLGRLFRDRAGAAVLLVSGGARTRRSLARAGCAPGRMVDVLDAGVSPGLLARPRSRRDGVGGRFACIGRMVDDKGFDLAIRAVAQAGPGVELVLHGDGPERPALEALARDLRVTEQVRFAGWLDHAALGPALDSCDAFVMPSLAEANGIAMQEAMALGLPVVAFDWGGPGDLGRDGGALMVPVGAAQDMVAGLAGAMRGLAADPARAEAIGAQGRALARARFGWPQVAESWSRHYDDSPAPRRRAGDAQG
ncbi:glycosyltransferase family 4 protein [Limimaricola sp.]|uniref:glycosyltransferase family 4 protein n=1 Tax=Limimaricola sp. TaxID=2211665 RepID=UPI004057E0BF